MASPSPSPRTENSPPDLRERGAPRDGVEQILDRRLFIQLLAFQCGPDLAPHKAIRRLGRLLEREEVTAVIYEDVNQPNGIALVSASENPEDFVEKVRHACLDGDLTGLRSRPELAMLGRTYSSGFENDLEFWLLRRPRETLLNETWPWAIWYPLRRTGAFEQLDGREKGTILREHGGIGRSYGEADLAHDIRLACHGLDQNDNEFVIGLIGKDLYPLSHVVQSMRRTRQTAEFMQQMGPFFVGHAVWRNAGA